MRPGPYRYRRIGLSMLKRSFIIGILTGMTQLAFAETKYAAAWGPGVGSMVPMLAASDQDGNPQTLDTLKGTNGLLFVFNRSVDW